MALVTEAKRPQKKPIPVWVETIILAIIGGLVFFALSSIQAFEALYEYSRAHEDWDLDELVLIGPVLALVLVIFAINRVRQLRQQNTVRNQLQEELLKVSTTYQLTGLSNEQMTVNRFKASIISAGAATPNCVALIRTDLRWQVSRHCDMDFVGPAMRELVERLKSALPENSQPGALDNDTIIVRLPHNQTAAETSLRRILALLAVPIHVGMSTITPHIRIGAAMLDNGNRDVVNALAEAMIALESVSISNGKPTLVFYDRTEEARTIEKRKLLERTISAFENDEFYCVYQPILDLRTGAIVSFEALSRWTPASGPAISPEVFIPLITEAGLMGRFTDRVLEKALTAASQWPRNIGVSVNLAREQLMDLGLSARIFRRLKAHEISARRLDIEITETQDMMDVDASNMAIESLRSLGMQVSIDDFGAGYSNLNLLHDIEFDCIKIDRKVITDILTNPKDRAIVSAVLQMTSAMGRSLTAEGVEDTKTADLLRKLGVQKAQGFLYAKPMAATATLEFIKSSKMADDRRIQLA